MVRTFYIHMYMYVYRYILIHVHIHPYLLYMTFDLHSYGQDVIFRRRIWDWAKIFDLQRITLYILWDNNVCTCIYIIADTLKISDFGLSTVFRHMGKERKLSRRCGTPPYIAPEVGLHEFQKGHLYWGLNIHPQPACAGGFLYCVCVSWYHANGIYMLKSKVPIAMVYMYL